MQYRDADGNAVTLVQLVTHDPGWAVSRIREAEKAAKEMDRMQRRLAEYRGRAIAAEGQLVLRHTLRADLEDLLGIAPNTEMTPERLQAVVQQVRKGQVAIERLAKLLAMQRGFTDAGDKCDDYTPTIERLHPMDMDDCGGQRLVLAERLVHNRHSKWALVYLVHALLHERDTAQAEVARLQAGLEGATK